MDIKFRKLIELGAGKFELLDSRLLAHLESTRCLLKEWNGDLVLQQAGLYYVCYSEHIPSSRFIATSLRNSVIEILGAEVETIIYYFNIWDKASALGTVSSSGEVSFRNKITGEAESLPYLTFCQMCELYGAIEVDNISKGRAYASKANLNFADFSSNLPSLLPFLSSPAMRKIQLTNKAS